jgi:hypothetical protein
MNNFIQQSNQIHSILNQWYSKHYSKKRNFDAIDVYEDMASRLGNPYFESLVMGFSSEDRTSTFEELPTMSKELFNSFYTTLINYKF